MIDGGDGDELAAHDCSAHPGVLTIGANRLRRDAVTLATMQAARLPDLGRAVPAAVKSQAARARSSLTSSARRSYARPWVWCPIFQLKFGNIISVENINLGIARESINEDISSFGIGGYH